MTAAELLLAELDGVPASGSHAELRLSPDELEALQKQFPDASVCPLAAESCDKNWYQVQL